MTVFASGRERRLWAGTLAVGVAILATVGLARALADALAGTRLGDALFVLAIPIVVATVVTHGLRVRPGGLEIAVGLGIVAAYLLVFARMAIEVERSHLIEYGVLAVFIHAALTERASHGRRVPVPAVLAIGASSAVGVVDELVQLVVPGRVFDPADIVFNVGASAMAVTASVALGWARRRRWRR